MAVYFREIESELPWINFSLEAKLSKEINQEVQVIMLNRLAYPTLGFEVIKDGLLLVDKEPQKKDQFRSKYFIKVF